jgi:predicted RNA binding protein YcfA (HicA-like mRNA interferase family)
MPSLPTLSGRAVAKAFGRDGWELARKKDSHMILVKEGSWVTLSVPDHRAIAPGTLRSLIRARCAALSGRAA